MKSAMSMTPPEGDGTGSDCVSLERLQDNELITLLLILDMADDNGVVKMGELLEECIIKRIWGAPAAISTLSEQFIRVDASDFQKHGTITLLDPNLKTRIDTLECKRCKVKRDRIRAIITGNENHTASVGTLTGSCVSHRDRGGQ